VVESELPASSYVLPTRQLVIVSYLGEVFFFFFFFLIFSRENLFLFLPFLTFPPPPSTPHQSPNTNHHQPEVLLLVCAEALLVYNVASWERVLTWFQGMRRAKCAREALVAAQQQRRDDEEEEREREQREVEVEAEKRAALGVYASAESPRVKGDGGDDDEEEHGKRGATAAAVVGAPPPPRSQQQQQKQQKQKQKQQKQQPEPRPSLGRYLSLSRSFVPPRGSPWSSWNRNKRGRGIDAGASAVVDAAELQAAGESSSGGAGATDAATQNRARLALTHGISLTGSRRRRQDIARQLDADARASWYAYVAWR